MSNKFLRRVDGRQAPEDGEVAIFWPTCDCTDVYESQGFEISKSLVDEMFSVAAELIVV